MSRSDLPTCQGTFLPHHVIGWPSWFIFSFKLALVHTCHWDRGDGCMATTNLHWIVFPLQTQNWIAMVKKRKKKGKKKKKRKKEGILVEKYLSATKLWPTGIQGADVGKLTKEKEPPLLLAKGQKRARARGGEVQRPPIGAQKKELIKWFFWIFHDHYLLQYGISFISLVAFCP